MCNRETTSFVPSPAIPTHGFRVFCKPFCRRPYNVDTFLIPRAQASFDGEPEGDESSRTEENLLQRLGQLPDPPQLPNPRVEYFRESRGQLAAGVQYLTKGLNADIERLLSDPFTQISSAIIAILFGNFSATAAATIIGSVADWDPLAAAVLLVWTEGFTKLYYKLRKKTKLLRLINAFKIGLMYGMTIDAFKLST